MENNRKILLKPGVKLSRNEGDRVVCIAPDLLSGIYLAANAYYEAQNQLSKTSEVYNSMPYFTITSICDGKHMEGSKHYEGKAFDIRTWADSSGQQLSKLDKLFLKKRLSQALGKDYDVVIESTHIHIEIDKED